MATCENKKLNLHNKMKRRQHNRKINRIWADIFRRNMANGQ